MTSILLADHHSLFRAGMVKLIDAIGGFTLAAEVDTAGAAVDYGPPTLSSKALGTTATSVSPSRTCHSQHL